MKGNLSIDIVPTCRRTVITYVMVVFLEQGMLLVDDQPNQNSCVVPRTFYRFHVCAGAEKDLRA